MQGGFGLIIIGVHLDWWDQRILRSGVGEEFSVGINFEGGEDGPTSWKGL